MEKINENIVLLCDTREADETVTLYSNNLEFSTKLYFDTIVESLKNLVTNCMFMIILKNSWIILLYIKMILFFGNMDELVENYAFYAR